MAEWTILTYIAAHNNLAALGQRSLLEILGVGSSPEVVHGVLFDEPAGCARYIMGEPGLVTTQNQLGSFDSGDADGLVETARWLFTRHPARRYGLVLWSHGTGWQPAELAKVAAEVHGAGGLGDAEARDRSGGRGSLALFRSTIRQLVTPDDPVLRAILFDDETRHALDTLELARVARQVQEAVGQPLELLGMDACLMASLEVAHELRAAVRYLVASEELVPGHSWPYAEIYGGLRKAPTQDGASLARLVVRAYLDRYTANPPSQGDVTKVALDLSRLGQCTGAVDALAGALLQDMGSQAPALWKVQQRAQAAETSQGSRQPSKFDYTLWDVGSLARGLAAEPTASAAVRSAAGAVVTSFAPGAGPVLAEGHRGAWFDGIGGVTAYLPPPGLTRVPPAYQALAFARETRWAQLLAAYQGAGP
jgi:hypothetical protein